MAQTAKALAPAELFAVQDTSKHLHADRLLTATPAPYWIWPIKKFIAAYQVHKGLKYQKEGQSILQSAEEKSEDFREGPAVGLRKEHARVVRDFKAMYENPEQLSAEALRRQKHHARRSRNNIFISTEAFEARGTYCIAVGARDDTGMPLSITSLTTTSTSQQLPPRHAIIEPMVPSQQGQLFSRSPDLQVADPSPALKNTLEWAVAQLSIEEVPEESGADLSEGHDDELLCRGPSGAIPAAA